MSEKDLRQFGKMQQQINAYKKSKITLKVLIGDLIFLRDALEVAEKEWEYKFTDSVVDLESVYTYLLEKNLNYPDELTVEIVSRALKKLENLIPESAD